MADEVKVRHCPRCGAKGTVQEEGGRRKYFCPNTHGVIWDEPLPEKEAEAQPEAADAATGSAEPAAAPQKREPKALN